MKKREERKAYIKICPKCKSFNIKTNYKGGLVFLGVPPSYICQNCGYASNIFPVLLVEKKRKKWKKKK